MLFFSRTPPPFPFLKQTDGAGTSGGYGGIVINNEITSREGEEKKKKHSWRLSMIQTTPPVRHFRRGKKKNDVKNSECHSAAVFINCTPRCDPLWYMIAEHPCPRSTVSILRMRTWLQHKLFPGARLPHYTQHCFLPSLIFYVLSSDWNICHPPSRRGFFWGPEALTQITGAAIPTYKTLGFCGGLIRFV